MTIMDNLFVGHEAPEGALVRRAPARHAASPTRKAGYMAQEALPTPMAILPRWDNGQACADCQTTTVWSTYYVDKHGSSTTCTTTEYDATTLTTSAQPTITQPTTAPFQTVFQTTTSTLYEPASATGIPSPVPAKTIQSEGQYCGCERAWLHLLLGGVPHGAAEVIASLVFFIFFLLYLLCSLMRLFKYSYNREIFFILLPFVIFLTTMVGMLPTRAYTAENDSTSHILAQTVMLAIAPPVLLEVALLVYSLLRKRAQPSGWIDATSLFLRVVNITALVLYAVAAAELVTFVNGWEHGTISCANGLPSKISTLNIVADFLELIALFLGFFFLFWVRWRLRVNMGVILIQVHIFVFLSVFFIWRTAHDVNAHTAWSDRNDRSCSPLGAVYDSGSSADSTSYYFNMPWSTVQDQSHDGLNGQAAFWLLAVLPLFLAATLLMAVNLYVYVDAVPDVMPQADSARYKLCYNEDSKKMEFVRLDNPGGPRLPDGEPLYEIVRDDSGDGWEIREARVPTVLPVWQNMTISPWYC